MSLHEIAPGCFSLIANDAPPTADQVDGAWQRFRTLAMQAQEHPHLRDDPGHRAKRDEAHARFTAMFERMA